MPVEFIGMISTQDQSETRPSSGPAIDKDYVRRFARAHEDAGFDRVLIGYNSSKPDGTQVAAAAKGELHDRALWTPLAAATGAAGNSTALVGTPDTVAQALLDYTDIGVSTLLIRGYDPYHDAVSYGQALLPLVRNEIARRERHLGPVRPGGR
jgi:alkanesulfonate monooxygenase SsuD/methylene tetrahydromethanopterin reductase-like flavin-dependent oxidoreductase (luciferase family)